MGEFTTIAVSASLFLGLVFLMAGLLYRGMRLGMRRMRYSSAAVRNQSTGLIITVIGWLLFTGMLSILDLWYNGYTMYLTAIAPLVSLYFIYTSSKFTKIVMKMPKMWLVNIRFISIFFDIMFWFLHNDISARIVPKHLTIEGFNYNMPIAAVAFFVAYRCFKTKEWGLRWAIAWNIVGILVLLVNLGWIITLSPGALQLITDYSDNGFIYKFPFIWYTTFVIPFFILMNLLSLKTILYRTADSTLDDEDNITLVQAKRKRRR